jgi:hypothetical protein
MSSAKRSNANSSAGWRDMALEQGHFWLVWDRA